MAIKIKIIRQLRHWIFMPVFLFSLYTYSQDTLFIEMFDYAGSSLPTGWVNNILAGDGEWKMGVGAGSGTAGQSPLPDSTAYGQQNIYFRRPEANQLTRIITPNINTEFAAKPQLSFYHAQYPAGTAGNYLYNRLRVLVRDGNNPAWVELAHYSSPTFGWVERFIDIPYSSPDVQIAFQGFQDNPGNNSVCVDAVLIIDIGSLPRELTNIATTQASTSFITTGTNDNQVLRTQFRVIGNEGVIELEKFTVQSKNTNDNDIKTDGVKLYLTNVEDFNTNNLIAQGNFNNEIVVFDNLEQNLPTGYSYVWVAFDVKETAGQGNTIDALIPANGITVNGITYPENEHNPLGYRVILHPLFYDDFETNTGWDLSGEWQIDIPQGLGGGPGGTTEGNPGASNAVIGTKILGTDLTGLGEFPGNYEKNLAPREYQATMPDIDCFYYQDISISFYRWLNVYIFDDATLEISSNNGVNWSTVYSNTTIENEASWNHITYDLPQARRKENIIIRFTLGNTGTENLQSGWNIDEVMVTGSYITRDVGVTDWLMPQSTCGLSDQEEVTIVVKNMGAFDLNEDIPVGFSIDGGSSWHLDTIRNASLNSEESMQYTFVPKADFSTPGNYDNIIARTFLQEDQDELNDIFNFELYNTPSYSTPYYQSFEADEGFWLVFGANKTLERAIPSGTTLNNAWDGNYAWITNSEGAYNPGETSWVESPCFDFSNIEYPVLEFSIKLDTQEELDGLTLDYSYDEGENWIRLEPYSLDLAWNWHEDSFVAALYDYTENGAGWSGFTSEWKRVKLVLPDEFSGEGKVKFRFLFASQADAPVTIEEGVAIDAFEIYQTPYDVGVNEFIEPISDCKLSEEEISIRVKNFGIRTIPAGTIIPAGININDSPPVIEDFELSNDLDPDSEVVFTFNHLFDFSEVGDYAITAYTILEGDTDFFTPGIFNDTINTSITVFGFPYVSIWPTDTLYTILPDTIVFDAGEGFTAYLWQDNSEDQTFSVTDLNTQLYYATVTDNNNCQSTDSVIVYTRDLEITELVSPVSQCEFFEPKPVIIKISNVSYDHYEAGLELPIDLYFEDTYIETKTLILNTPLHPEEYVILEFDFYADLPEFGEYDFQLEMLINDAFPDNNSVDFNVISYGYPEPSLPAYIVTDNPSSVLLNPGEGYSSYLWNDGSELPSLNISDWGEYSVVVTNEGGCEGFASTKVVPPVYDPALTEIISPANTCFEDEIELTVSTTIHNFGPAPLFEGTSLAMHFELENNKAIVSEILTLTEDFFPDSSFVFTFNENLIFNTPGLFSIKIWLEFQDDENTDNNELEELFSLSPLPVSELPDTVFTSSPLEYTLDAGAGFASYLWQDGSTSQYYNITNGISQWYYVTIENEYACFSTDSVYLLTYDWEISSIISPKSSCVLTESEPVAFRIKNSGYDTFYSGFMFAAAFSFMEEDYIYQNFYLSKDLMPNEYIDFMFKQTVDLSDVGEYYFDVFFELIDANPDNNHKEANIDIIPEPTVYLGPDIYSDYIDTIYLDAGAGHASYLWHDGFDEQIFRVYEFGLQWVEVADIYNCKTRDSLLVFPLTNIHEYYDEKLRVYPNPAYDYLIIENAAFFEEDVVVQIIDIKGDVLSSLQKLSSGTKKIRLNINDLKEGGYFIRIIGNKEVAVLKFSKMITR